MRFHKCPRWKILMIALLISSTGCSNTSKMESYTINEEDEYQDEQDTEKVEDEIEHEIEHSEMTSTSSKEKSQSNQYSMETSVSPSVHDEIISVSEDFLVGSSSVTIDVAIPNGWNYRKWDVEEESADWGIEIRVECDEDSIIMISGQYGTLNVSGLYPNDPEIFVTDQGIKTQYYKDEYQTIEGETYVNQQIVIGQLNSGFYGISIQMSKKNFDNNAESIQKLLKSVKIFEN